MLIAAAAWGADPKLAEKINFAVGVSSLILALLAIYVTISFNSLFSNNVTTFLGVNQRIEEAAAKLLTATADLTGKIEVVPTGLEDLSKKLDLTTEKLLAVGSSPTSVDAGGLVKLDWTKDELMALFLRMPVHAMVCVYLAIKSDHRGRRFSSAELSRVVKVFSSEFFTAIAGTYRAAQIWEYQLVGDIHVVTGSSTVLAENMEDWMDSIVEVYEKENLDAAVPRLLRDGKAQVEELLHSKSPPNVGEQKQGLGHEPKGQKGSAT